MGRQWGLGKLLHSPGQGQQTAWPWCAKEECMGNRDLLHDRSGFLGLAWSQRVENGLLKLVLPS